MRRRWVLLSVLVVALLSGCTVLPESGSVHTVDEAGSGQTNDAPYFKPPGPTKGAARSAVAAGFLRAMQANPLSTSVARTFLTEHSRASWRPDQGTLVYEASTVTPDAHGVRVRLADTRRLDARGGWRGGEDGRADTLRLRMVSEHGQWRIDAPPNAMIVPTWFFDSGFARFNLYFYDQTGRVLLPDPVFIPRGEQTATNLVRGLLEGPGSALADISRSALPRRTALDLSVVVTQGGVAEVPLSRDVLSASRSELARAVAQLAWTLRQVPGIDSVRLTAGGVPVPLPGGAVDAPVSSGAEYDADGTGAAFLWGLRGGKVVDLGTEPVPVAGPFGRPGYSLRSIAVSESPRRIAAVSADGHVAYAASAESSPASGKVTRLVDDGTDLLRPQFDMFGDLWLVDRTTHGARVRVVRGHSVRVLDVPGVSGADVAAFAISRDGSRLAVAYAGSPAPRLRVVDVLRTDEGIVSGAGADHTFSDGRTDAARIVDLGWRDAGTLAVLTRPTSETSAVTYVSADGSPVDAALVDPSVFRGQAQALVVAPDVELPLRLITPDQRMYTLDATGSWPRSTGRVLAATYVR